MKNNTIQWQYAVNFDENEKRWEEVEKVLIAKVRTITKNPMLSLTMIDEAIETTQMIKAIQSGDRSEFLYNKAKKAADDSVNLEEAGELFAQAFCNALSKQTENEH